MEAVAKLFLGLVFIALFIQTMKLGPQGATMWLRAKFLGAAV